MKVQTSNPKDRIGITKVPLHLIPLTAQIHQALAHLEGACKYGRDNWRQESVAAGVYVGAALRHILKYWNGQDFDEDSGVHHLGHAAACLNILMDAQQSGNLVDDRVEAEDAATALDAAKSEVIRILKRHGEYTEPTPTVVVGFSVRSSTG